MKDTTLRFDRRNAFRLRLTRLAKVLLIFLVMKSFAEIKADDIPDTLQKWMQPQDWQRDTKGPIIKLGSKGEFDDTHLLAPCVSKIEGLYYLWYNGSTGAVKDRVFQLGLATSRDGRKFKKHSANPVFQLGDSKHSVLTSTLLRRADGSPIREDGKLRMWFTSAGLAGDGFHALRETQSVDGLKWEPATGPLLQDVYAPTVLKEKETYRIWYTDVSRDTWVFRTATSSDGRNWKVHPEAVLKPKAGWESSRIFYPTVLKVDGVYLMWYGSYWSARKQTTAIGFAASVDGIHWHRNAHSPVFRPDTRRPWESNYTTSQSVIRNDDGSFRMWYASRKKPPFVNKYFAICTAKWGGPDNAKANTGQVPSTVAPIENKHSRRDR